MNKTHLISFAALLVLVIAFPVYALSEPARMEITQSEFRTRFVAEGAGLYLDYCALCHGASGEGIGVMPGLNHPALAEADQDSLFRTIARAAHGTTMAAWHVEEGGVLNDYQIGELVAVIRYADWDQVAQLAEKTGYTQAPLPAAETGLAFLEGEGDSEDPHACVTCHEEPEVHAGRFGVNCARCHSAVAWTPAVLTKHTFALDHGGQGKVECETCHVANYYEHTCYECHDDHQPAEMEAFHTSENILDLSTCVDCHPTGAEGEAGQLRQQELEELNPNISTIPTLGLATPPGSIVPK